MASPEKVLTHKILKRHGSRADLRIWRNETGLFWTAEGGRIKCGLCTGSADIIGIMAPRGKFIALEVKVAGTATTSQQTKFLACINRMGGIAGVVKDMAGADFLLGEPPKRKGP